MTGRFLSLAALLTLAACASVPTPTYRDFEVRAAPSVTADTSLTARLGAAVTAAGWTADVPVVTGIVTTAPRPVPGGVFSRATARLDLMPLNAGAAHGARFVRVVVRAERRSFLGGRTKVFALDGGTRRALLGPISEALAVRGLVALDAPRDRDEDATDD